MLTIYNMAPYSCFRTEMSIDEVYLQNGSIGPEVLGPEIWFWVNHSGIMTLSVNTKLKKI